MSGLYLAKFRIFLNVKRKTSPIHQSSYKDENLTYYELDFSFCWITVHS